MCLGRLKTFVCLALFVILTLLWWSGTKPTVSPGHACIRFADFLGFGAYIAHVISKSTPLLTTGPWMAV